MKKVSENLPPVGKKVLGWNGEKWIVVALWYVGRKFTWYDENNFYELDDIKYWHHLPQPPEGEK